MKGKFKNITDEKPMITSRPWIYRCSDFFIDVLGFYMQFTNGFIFGVPFYINSSLMCPPILETISKTYWLRGSLVSSPLWVTTLLNAPGEGS